MNETTTQNERPTHIQLVAGLKKPGSALAQDMDMPRREFLGAACVLSNIANVILSDTVNTIQVLPGFADPNDPMYGDILDLWHAVVGIASEAGEILDLAKKHAIYGQALDVTDAGKKNMENLREELGDLHFYVEQLRQNAILHKPLSDFDPILVGSMVEFHSRIFAALMRLDHSLVTTFYVKADQTKAQILDGNIDKLLKRYPDGKWTAQHAQARLDKVEPTPQSTPATKG